MILWFSPFLDDYTKIPAARKPTSVIWLFIVVLGVQSKSGIIVSSIICFCFKGHSWT